MLLLEMGWTSSLVQKKMYARQLSARMPTLFLEQQVLECREKVYHEEIAILLDLEGPLKMEWLRQHSVERSYQLLMLYLYWTLHCHLMTVSA